MKKMTMRERMLAVIQGREHDQVPFVMYDVMLPLDEVYECLGVDRIGLLRWDAVHRVEHPNCQVEREDTWENGIHWQHTVIQTPAGSIEERKAFDPAFDAGTVRDHFIQEEQDYDVLWSYLEDAVVLPDYDRYLRDQEELGERGLPLPAVERSPWQQLWIEWVGLERLSLHTVDHADRVARTMDLLRRQARRIFDVVREAPVPYINFPDNITAPAIGPSRFRAYAVPLYNELAGMLAECDVPVFCHMDGDLRPLWDDIAACGVRGLDSFTPPPDCDTAVGTAAEMWPEKRLWVNFPSSAHLLPVEEVRAVAEGILAEAGHTGRLQIQVSENVPLDVWRRSFPAIVEAIETFGTP